MARQSRSVSRLQDQLKNARARARRAASSDPIQKLGMGAVGGAIMALMNNNKLKQNAKLSLGLHDKNDRKLVPK